jgi:hypothetical protein
MADFNVLAVVAATLLVGGTATAKEKPEQPKERKVCRTEQMSGRITPQRICRKVPVSREKEEGRASDRTPGEATGRAN